MDLSLWQSLFEGERPPFCKTTIQLRGVTGQHIKTIGCVDVTIGQTIISVILVQTDDPTLFILGYDALNRLNATVDTTSHELIINGQRLPRCMSQANIDVLTWEQKWEREFPSVFAPSENIGCNSTIRMTLRMKDTTPIRRAPYRTPLFKRREVEKQVSELLDKGIIRHSNSPWASPITLVPKKDGGTRMCVDYRRLNTQTHMDAYPLPRIQDVLDQMAGSAVFSLIDLRQGFHQIPMDPDSISLTAFVTHTGLYEYTRMPFGLKTAPGVFQRAMNEALAPVLGQCAIPYLDDVCVFSPSNERHELDVRRVLSLLADKGFTAKASKCHFNLETIDILGFSISKAGIKPQQSKVRAIQEMDAPSDVTSLRRFLGMVGYHRAMIPQYSEHSCVLTDLTRKHTQWKWESQHQSAFEYLRDVLVSDDVMMCFPDLNRPFEVYTDASNVAVGAILVQRDDLGHPRPVQYVSATLNNTQRRWPAIEKVSE